MSELILGTAQFGDAYGVMNTSGALSDDDVQSIAKLALDSGIHLFDTSPLYGNAETRIQKLVTSLGELAVVTKFALPENDGCPLEALVTDRLETLSPVPIAGLLFHRVQDLRDPRVHDAWAMVKHAQKDGKLGKVGASIYGPDDLEVALATLPGIDLLQVPGNIVDQRLLDHPLLSEFHAAGGTVHVRSAYLQGLLLSNPTELPKQFRELAPTLKALHDFADTNNASLASLLLGYLKHHPMVDGVVVGALSQHELHETIQAWDVAISPASDLPRMPDEILDPRLWQRNNS